MQYPELLNLIQSASLDCDGWEFYTARSKNNKPEEDKQFHEDRFSDLILQEVAIDFDPKESSLDQIEAAIRKFHSISGGFAQIAEALRRRKKEMYT